MLGEGQIQRESVGALPALGRAANQLPVEALVIDPDRPYHVDFDPVIVEVARKRLDEHGFEDPASGSPEGTAPRAGGSAPRLEPGTTFDLRVTVAGDGAVSLTVI